MLNSFSDWKRLVETVNSPSNCMTWDCGVTRELGEDPLVVGNWLASRNRIGQVSGNVGGVQVTFSTFSAPADVNLTIQAYRLGSI